MKIHKILFILSVVLSIFVSNAKEHPTPKTFTKEEIIAFGTAQLQQLIQLNTINEQQGAASKNRYVFFTKNVDLPIEKVKEFVWATNYGGKESQLEELNTKLIEINAGLKAPIYIGVNLDMGRVDLTSKVTGYSTVKKLDDLLVQDKEEALRKLLITPVDNLYTEINTAITSSVDNPITVNAMGFFQVTYTEGKPDEVFVKRWLRQMLVMKHFDTDPEIAKKRTAIIKEALRKNGIGLRLTSTGDISLTTSKEYLERYKTAINEYWDADMDRFTYDYSYNVNNIDDWYQSELAEKETGAFDPKANSDKYVYDYTGLFFTVKADVANYLRGYTNVQGYGKPKIILTDDFTDYNRLLEIEAAMTAIKDDSPFIWIHVSKENKVVQQNIYHKGYKLVLEPTLTTRLENFGNNLFESGMSAEKSLAVLVEMDAIITQFGSVVFGGLSDGLSAVEIPKEFWDSASTGYYFKDLNTRVAEVPVVKQLVQYLQNDIAFIAGIYNGFISTLNFVAQTGEFAFNTKVFIKKILSEPEYRNKVLAEAKEVADLLKTEESREAVWMLAKVLVVGEIEKGWEYQLSKIKNDNLTGVYYFAGNITFEIVIAVLSAGISAEAGIAKEFLAVLKWATEPLEFVIKGGKKLAAPVAKLMTKGFKIATDGAVKIGNKILFKIDINTSKIVLMADAVISSMDSNFSEVLEIITPEGFVMKMDGADDALGSKILKIIKDTQGTYKLLVENLDNLVQLTDDLKNAFDLTDINKAKQLAEKLGADRVAKIIAKADIIKKAGDDVLILLNDIADNSDFTKFIDELTEGLVDNWKIVSDLPDSKNWVRKNIDILRKFDGLSVVQQNRLRERYKNLKLPPNAPQFPPFTMTKSIDGIDYTVTYNQYGFPRMDRITTKFTGANGENLMRSYPNRWNLGDVNKDLRDASTWAMNNFPSNRVRRSKTKGGKTSYTKIDLLDDNGNWITQTWHHHENAIDLFPVPSKAHNFGEGGFDHSGGNTISNGNPSLEGVFDYTPIFD